jgi:transcriptional regulator with XRE-family HTH domain
MAKSRAIRHEDVVRRFGERLREVRRTRGMTQARLAELADVTVGYISRVESGTGGAVGLDLLARLAAALATTVADLVPTDDAPDTDGTLRTEIRRLTNDLLTNADRDTLLLLAQLLSRLSQAD